MLELTFSFDAQLEANHASSEDTQAQLDEFRQMPWIKPDYKAVTLDTLRKVETEADTAYTLRSTIRPPFSARNPPCT